MTIDNELAAWQDWVLEHFRAADDEQIAHVRGLPPARLRKLASELVGGADACLAERDRMLEDASKFNEQLVATVYRMHRELTSERAHSAQLRKRLEQATQPTERRVSWGQLRRIEDVVAAAIRATEADARVDGSAG